MAECSVPAPSSQIASGAPWTPGDDPFWPGGYSFARALAGARARDAEALSLLYRRFLPVVYRFLLARVRDVPLAEDLTSETFFAVMSGLASARANDEMAFATWALGIARNKLSQFYRQRQRAREVPLSLVEADGAQAFGGVGEADDPLAAVVAQERWEEVVAALNRLTTEQRTVLLHRLILGRSTDEVARLMGKPANAVYGLQFRALASLARFLREPGQPKAPKPAPKPTGREHGREHGREREGRDRHGA